MITIRKRIVIAALLLLFIAALAPLTAETGDDLKVIAITGIGYSSGLPLYRWMSAYFENRATEMCLADPSIRVVERKNLDSVVEEMKLSLTGLTESEGLDAASLLIADYLLTGEYSVNGKNINLNLNLVEVRSGAVAAAVAEIGSLDGPDSLVSASVGKLLGNRTDVNSVALFYDLKQSQSRELNNAKQFYSGLPFHELHPRRRRMTRDFQSYISELSEIIAENPEAVEPLYLTAYFHLQQEMYEEAGQYFEYLAGTENGKLYGLLGLGDLARFKNDQEEAVRYYKEIMASSVDLLPDAYYGMVKSCIKNHEDDAALEYLLKLLEIKPELDAARNLLGTFMENDTLAEKNPVLHCLRAFKNGQPCSSGLLEESVKSFPGYYLIHYLLGKQYLNAADYSMAESSFTACRKLYPGFDKTYLELGRIYMKNEEYKKAADYFSIYIALSNDGSDFVEVRNLIDFCMGKLQG